MEYTEINLSRITFEQGLPGFEQLKYFKVARPYKEYPFYYLNALEAEEVSFLVISPFDFKKSYEIDLPVSVQETLEIINTSDVLVFNIVNCLEGLSKATVNLVAPVVINAVKSKGMQVVLDESKFNIKEPLISFLQQSEGK